MPVRRVRRRHVMYAAPQRPQREQQPRSQPPQDQDQEQQKQNQQKRPKSDPPPPPSAEAGPSRLFDTPDVPPPPPPYEARVPGECERHRVLDPTRPVHDYGAVGAAK